MGEADKDGSGTLNFYDFLVMMRQYYDEKDEEYITKESAAIAETGFSKEEVQSFKDIYGSADKDNSGELSKDEVRAMLQVVVHLNDDQVKELTGILTQCDEDGNRETDFPEFLKVMKKVQDLNFADINSRSEQVVRRMTVQSTDSQKQQIAKLGTQKAAAASK